MSQDVVYLTLKQSKKAIVLCVMAQKYMPTYKTGHQDRFGAILWGQSGIGKNAITNDLGVELSASLGEMWIQMDCNLAGMAPEDIHGIPAIRTVKDVEVVKYFNSIALPANAKGIFRLDEIDRPAYFQTLIAMAKYSIDRTDHLHTLPYDMFVLGLGNGTSDGHTETLSEHLRGRFCHLYVSTQIQGAADDHIEYMKKAGFSDAVIRMVQSNPVETRDEFEEITAYNNRTIKFADAILKAYKDLKSVGSDFSDVLLATLAGCVGKNAALEIIRIEEMSHLPTLSEIVNSPMTAIVPDDLSLRQRYLTMLVHDAKSDCDKAATLIKYIGRYPAELARFQIERLILDCHMVAQSQEYIDWQRKNS